MRALVVLLVACHPASAPAPMPATAAAGATIAEASRLWLAGDLDGAAKRLASADGDPRARALLARAYAMAGKLDLAARTAARLADTTVHIATDVSQLKTGMLSPDGAYAATFEGDPERVTVWSTVTGRDLYSIVASQARFGIDPATHDTRLVVWHDRTSRSGEIVAYDAATGHERWVATSPHRVYDVAIDRRGRLTALTDDRGALEQFELATGAKLRDIHADSNAAVLQLSDDGDVAISAESIFVLPPAGSGATKLAEPKGFPWLSPDGRTLAFVNGNGEIALTERDGTPRVTIAHAGDELAFVDDGTLLAFDKGHVRRFDMAGKPVAELDLPAGLGPVGYRTIVAGRDGHLLARRGAQLVVLALATDHATIISSFGGATRATALAWSADGTRLAIAGANQTQTVWTPAGATVSDLHARYNRPLDRVAFDAAGKLVDEVPDAHELVDRRIFVRDATMAPVRYVEADESLVAYARAGSILVGVGESGHVHVWNADTGAGLGDIGPAEPAIAVAVRPDGKLLAIARRRGDVELWDVASRTQVLAISAGAPAAEVAPDGSFDGDRRGLVRRAGGIDVPMLPGETPQVGLAATVLAMRRTPAAVAPTPPAKLAPRGCVPPDEGRVDATLVRFAGDALFYCLKPPSGDPYCFTSNLKDSVVSVPAPIEAIAPAVDGPDFERMSATATGLRICTGPRACRDVPVTVDLHAARVASSDDGALLAVDRGDSGRVEIYDASTGKQLARFPIIYGTPDQGEVGGRELGFLGHTLLTISVPCAGPCGQASMYDMHGKRVGELAIEASSFGAVHFHDDLYVLENEIDNTFVVQNAATGKVVLGDSLRQWNAAVSPARLAVVTGSPLDSGPGEGTILVYDAALRPVARLDTPHCAKR